MTPPTRLPCPIELPPSKGVGEWWIRHRIDVCAGLYYIGLTLVGIIGFITPSGQMTETVGMAGVAIYSSAMLAMALVATIAVSFRWRQVESAALKTIAVLTLIHGMILCGAEDGSGIQTGIRLIVAVPMYFVVVFMRSDVALTKPQLRHQIKVVEAVDQANARHHGGDADTGGAE